GAARVSDTDETGALLLVATPIGNLGDLSTRAVEALRDADVIAAEDTRRTRALLSHLGVPAAGRLRSVHAHNEQESADWVVEAVGHVELSEPRGEHVIVLAPSPPPPAANDDEVDAHVTAALAEGLSTRDAAARVARDLRVPRRRTYDAAMRLKPKRT